MPLAEAGFARISASIKAVALSTSWGATPPNPGKPCRGGDSPSSVTEAVCGDFPMYMYVDYIRLWQDVSEGSTMALGCDPSTHPTQTFIRDNLGDVVEFVRQTLMTYPTRSPLRFDHPPHEGEGE